MTLQAIPFLLLGVFRRRTHRGLPLPALIAGVPDEPSRVGADCAPRSFRAAVLGARPFRFPFPPAQERVSPVGGDDPHAGLPDQPASVRLDSTPSGRGRSSRRASASPSSSPSRSRPVYVGHSPRALREESLSDTGHRATRVYCEHGCEMPVGASLACWRRRSSFGRIAVLTGRAWLRQRWHRCCGPVSSLLSGAACERRRVGAIDGSGFALSCVHRLTR